MKSRFEESTPSASSQDENMPKNSEGFRTAGAFNWLTAPSNGKTDWRAIFWLGLSLLFAAWLAGEGLRQAFRSQYAVQDDARQHVFWMERFLDRDLFPDDLTADYFQSVAPHGYTYLYEIGAMAGIDPLLLNKFLPPVLGLVTTAFCFGLCLQILRAPGAAFISTLLLNQSLWMQDDLVSATPRAFLYPLLMAFLYYLARGSLLPCLAALALQGLFYPSVVFVSVGILVLRLFDWRALRFSRDRRDRLFCLAGLAVSAVVLLIYALKSSKYGPVVTATEAASMPEFSANGRLRVFHDGFWEFWVSGQNSGMIPLSSLNPFTICSTLLLPVLLRFPKAFPLVGKISANIRILVQLGAASVLMFFASHLLLFRLYLPNRYTQHSLRIILCVGAGITLIVLLDAAVNLLRARIAIPSPARRATAIGLTGALAVALIVAEGAPKNFIQTRYRVGRESALYEFFSRTPKNTVIASLAHEADRIPAFSMRSNLVSWECSLPFHKGYYSQVRQRVIDLINAQYTSDLAQLQAFVRKYRIAFFLIDKRAFEPEYLANDKWIRLYQPAANDAARRLKEGDEPALAKLMLSCPEIATEDHAVISAECILNASN